MRPPIAIIDTENLRYNALEIKKLCLKSKFCAVVKSNAYGHGIAECSRAVYDIVDCFAVSLLNEAITLRYAGIDKDILMLLPPSKDEISALIRHGITITVDNPKRLNNVKEAASAINKTAKVAIAVNTGMNRLGIDSLQELNEMSDVCQKNVKSLKITDIFSHFANNYDLEFTQKQYENFLPFADKIKRDFDVKAHISASGGLLIGGYNLDMVRVGIMLYGYLPFASEKIKLKKVMTIKAQTIDTRFLREGDHLLYGDYIVKNNSKINIVNYGYTDCGKRKFMQGSVNNLCMDLSASENGGRVLSDADKIANENDTISYEVLTNATSRCELIYK